MQARTEQSDIAFENSNDLTHSSLSDSQCLELFRTGDAGVVRVVLGIHDFHEPRGHLLGFDTVSEENDSVGSVHRGGAGGAVQPVHAACARCLWAMADAITGMPKLGIVIGR